MSEMEGALPVRPVLAPPAQSYFSPDGRWRWDGHQWVPTRPDRQPFKWPAVAMPATGRVLAGVAIAAVLFDFASRAGAVGVAASGVIVIAALIIGSRVSGSWSRGCCLGAGLAGVGLSLRASPWLQVGDLMAGTTLLVVAAALARGGSPFDVPMRSAVAATWRSFLHVVAAPSFLMPPAKERGNRVIGGSRGLFVSILRGAAIGLPVVGVLGLLLASADPVFASFFNLSIDPPDLLLHALLWLIGAWIVGGVVRAASGETAHIGERTGWRVGATEATTALALLDLVFLAFAIAQLVGALGAGGAALRAAGVTYSDYARSGFFQLLWVAGITFVSILSLSVMVRADSPRSRLAVKVLAELAVALTLVILFVAWRRLSLYEDAYGWTMLRFYSHAIAAWIATAFCCLAIWIAGINSQRPAWIYGATATAGLGALVVLNLINPEAIVVRLNVSRPDIATFDSAYIAGLSDDAVPEALSPYVPARFAVRLRIATCSSAASTRDWAAFNLSSVFAHAKRAGACP